MEMVQPDRCGNCKYCYGIGISGGDGSVYNNYVCTKEKRHRVIMVDGPYSRHLLSRPSWCLGREDGEAIQLTEEQQDRLVGLLGIIMMGNGWEGTYIDKILSTPKHGAFNNKGRETIKLPKAKSIRFDMEEFAWWLFFIGICAASIISYK